MAEFMELESSGLTLLSESMAVVLTKAETGSPATNIVHN